MKDNFQSFKGHVEIDETYVGGKEKNKHSSKKKENSQGGANKETVLGIVQRREEKKVRAYHLPDNKPRTIGEVIKSRVDKGMCSCLQMKVLLISL